VALKGFTVEAQLLPPGILIFLFEQKFTASLGNLELSLREHHQKVSCRFLPSVPVPLGFYGHFLAGVSQPKILGDLSYLGLG
jgi:hypothetical protein